MTSTTDYTEIPVTKANMDLPERLQKHNPGFLRTIAEAVRQLDTSENARFGGVERFRAAYDAI